MTTNTAPDGMPIIASSDRTRDLEPYCRILFSQELRRFIDIFPCDFPQGDRGEEEAFLRTFFSDDEIRVHGGADGAGSGFRFLKQAWMWAAHWNLMFRVPAVAAHWMGENRTILNDPKMRKSLFEPDVQPGTFFNQEQSDLYGDKLLKVVIVCIQEQLLDLPPISGHRTPSGSSPPYDTSLASNTMENTLQPQEMATQAQNNVDKASPRDGNLQPKPSHRKVQSDAQRTSSSISQVQHQHHHHAGDATMSESNQRGGYSTRGSHRSTVHGSSGNRGARAGGKPAYGTQDARFQSPELAHQTYRSHGGAFSTGPPMQAHSVSATPFASAVLPMHPGSQLVGQPLAPDQMMYGYPPPQGNFHVQFQHHMPTNFSPGFVPQHPQPFGDRSNFPSCGRKFGDESRLFNPDEKSKHSKHGSGGGSLRGNKSRGHSSTQRGGNRGHSTFGHTGGNYAKEHRAFHRHASSDFYGPAGSVQVYNDNRFSMTPQEKYWQPPYWGNENGMAPPSHDQGLLTTTSNALLPAAGPQSPVPQSTENIAVSTHVPHYPSARYPGGHHRGLSRAMPCNPTECNKYAIGELCTYAKKLLIFQVPIDLKEAAFTEHFSKYGTVEEVHLGTNSDPSLAYPGLIHRSPSWVLFSDANSAREVLSLRGKPWAGGPLLFAEVAGEYWNPAVGTYRARRSSYGRQAGSYMRPVESVAGTPSQAPSINEGASGSSRDTFTTGYDSQKKKKGAVNNKKYKKNKGSGPDVSSKPSPDSTAVAITAKSPDDEANDTAAHKEAIMTTRVVGSGEPVATIDIEDLTTSIVPPDKVEDVPVVVFEQYVKAEVIIDQATGKSSDDQVDDSFHTADGSREEETDAPILDDSTSVAAVDHASSMLAEGLNPRDSDGNTLGGSEKPNNDSKTTVPAENSNIPSINPASGLDSSAPALDTSVISTAMQESSQQDHPVVNVEPTMSKNCTDAPKPNRSVATTIPLIDSHNVALSQNQDGDETVESPRARSVSGTSISEAHTSAYVTAPSTPAFAVPDPQIKSKKVPKSKGPAQTESLSLFAKPKRKSSSKKTKPTVHSSSRSISANSLRPSGSAMTHATHVELAAASPAVEGDSKAEEHVQLSVVSAAIADDGGNEVHVEHAVKAADVEDENKFSTLDGSDISASSHSSHETLSGSTWTSKKLAGTFRAIIAMTPSLSPVPQGMKSVATPASGDLLPEKTLDGQIPTIQLSELDGNVPKPEKLQDLTDLPKDELVTGLGIFDDINVSDTASENVQSPGSDESKPKKKKKAKGKSNKSKARASVTIDSSIAIRPKPNEPIHEFKGNDATSDSSSQTLGRTSPASNRPLLKQIDEAKQPKPLLEPRPSRQVRNKKHSSMYGGRIDGANSVEETAIATAESTAASPQKLTVILTPYGDGTFLEEQSEAMAVDDHALKPISAPLTPKLIPTPEKPYDNTVTDDVPSPSVEESIQRIRKMDLEAEKKRKFA